MPIVFNGTDIGAVLVDNVEINTVVIDGVTVFEANVEVLPPSNFTASDNLISQVQFDWVNNGGDIRGYMFQFYMDGWHDLAADSPIDGGIRTRYTMTIGLLDQTINYRMRAIYDDLTESEHSNEDTGYAHAPDVGEGNVNVYYDIPPTGSNPETVTGADGSYVFTPPSGVSEVTVCICGGGGGGAALISVPLQQGKNGGGGSGSTTHTIAVTPNVPVEITVGIGGVGGGSNNTVQPAAGGTSRFGPTLTVQGGGAANTAAGWIGGSGGNNGGNGGNGNATGIAQGTDGCGGVFPGGANGNIIVQGGGGGGGGFGAGAAFTSGTSSRAYIGAGGNGNGNNNLFGGAGGHGRLSINWETVIDTKHLMAVAHAVTPFISMYEDIGGVWTKMADVSGGLPASNGTGVAFNSAGTMMAVAHGLEPFISMYEDIGGVWTKMADVSGGLPPSNGNDVALNPLGTMMAVVHAAAPYISMYEDIGGVWTKMADVSGGLPTGAGNAVALNPLGTMMAVAHSVTPFISMYEDIGGVWTKMANPTGSLPTGIGRGVAML